MMGIGRHPSHRPSPVARAPRLYAICAAMMLACAFAANSASAQTQAECPAGQTRLTKEIGFGVPDDTGCVPNDAVAIMRDCEKAGWAGLDTTTTEPNAQFVTCGIPSQLYTETGSEASPFCWIIRGDSFRLLNCANMYGNPPVFPKAADHPNLNTDGSTPSPGAFVANCNRDGAVPGGYPPTHNIGGATECSCDLNSHIGEWPDCVAAPTLTRAQREAVRACTNQGWTISTTTSPIQCEIPLISGDGTKYPGCFFSGGAPLCADAFGAEYAFPDSLPPQVQGLVDGFRLIDTLRAGAIAAAAAAYADAVLGRYRREDGYINGAIGDHRRQLKAEFVNGGFVLIEVFRANGIPFSLADATDDNESLIALIRATFDMIPQIEPYVFNCGPGMAPASANTNGATECVRQTNLFLRLRVFLEGPLR